MRQAILTKYLGPTDHRGARVKATADAGSVTLSWDHALNSERNHERAALLLAQRRGWLAKAKLVGGAMPRKGYAFVLVEQESEPDDHDTTCGHCGRTWNDARTPTPAARCPFEYEHVSDD